MIGDVSLALNLTESFEMAEGVGFEPTVGYPTLDFESSALNRTQPPFPWLQDRQSIRKQAAQTMKIGQFVCQSALPVSSD